MCCFLNYRNEEGVWVMIPITSGRSHQHLHHVKRAMEVMKICTRILNVAMFQMKSVMSAFRYFFPRFANAVSEQMNNPVLFCFRKSLLLSWGFNVWSWQQTNWICLSLVDQVDDKQKKELIWSDPAHTTFSEVIKFPGKHFCFFTAYRKTETFHPEMSLKK